MGLSERRLAGPIALSTLASLLGILALIVWLPLLHTVLPGQARLGGRLQDLSSLLPENLGRAPLFAALATALVFLTLAKAGARYLADRSLGELTAAGAERLRERLVRRHLRFGQQWLDAAGPAQTVRNLYRVPERTARLARWLVRSGANGIELTLYGLLMAWLAPPLALVALTLMTAYYFGIKNLVEKAEARAGDEEEAEDRAAAEIQDLARNLVLIRLHTPEEEAVSAFGERAGRRAALAGRRQSLLRLIDEARQVTNVILLLAFVLAVGWLLGRFEGVAVSRYFVFFFVLRRAMGTFSSLQRLPRQWRNLRQTLDEVSRLLEGDEARVVPSGELPMPPLSRGLEVRKLTFAYEPGRPVLEDVSFVARRGRLNVLLGPNGSGKSALVELLLRLTDSPPGTLLADGVDLRDVDLAALRRATGYAGPEPMLLDSSLRENLTIGLGDVPEECLSRAAETAGLVDLVERLEGGFDHPLGSRGLRLSQGERQRVALARVLLRDPALVLLDEATSSVDAASEREAMLTLERIAAARVVLVVTHRVASIPDEAWVVLLEGGRVVAEGRCRELAATSEPFRRMATTDLYPERSGTDRWPADLQGDR